LLHQDEIARYGRQIILPELGLEGQERLKAARVLVVGAGGLGCPVLQYLTAAGIGTIGIADGDVVDVSNLQRQVLYTMADVGKSKALVAAQQLSAANPFVLFQVHQVFIDHTNALELCRNYDIVVDGSDNFDTRYLINDACVLLGKTMVSGAIYKFEGQVSVFNYKGGPTYRCLFPEPPGAGESPNCAEIGVVATLPGIIGTIQANEVIKVVTGIGAVLSGKLLVVDTLTMQTMTFNFGLNEANMHITALPVPAQVQCAVPPAQVSRAELDALLAAGAVQLVDVREEEEHAACNIGGVNMPLWRLEQDSVLLDPEKQVVVYCATGGRSRNAVAMLQQLGFGMVSDLKGGIM
jgi:adenylyltransferase/sulfurtransferase